MPFDFTQWPPSSATGPVAPGARAPQESRKPYDRLMPFHRIRVPGNQYIGPPLIPDRNNPPPNWLPPPKAISGDAYTRGARSTKDYDAKFGEDLGRDMADIVEKLIPVLGAIGAVSKAVSKALSAIVNLIPGGGKLAAAIDNFDPIVKLFEFIGNNVDAAMVDTFIRSNPAWVPVFDPRSKADFRFLEVDGILIRSHQRYDSVPYWQWHRWYDWRFAVAVSPPFSEMVGFGNQQREEGNSLGDSGGLQNYNREGLPLGALTTNSIAECEWDIGAIGVRSGPPGKDGGADIFPSFFDELQPRVSHDWCWPQAGMFFWAIGRSVYDCTRSSADNARRTKNKDRPIGDAQFSETQRIERGVHINQLHPLKAIATSRWEAFKFPENPKPVPAIQFMFYANIHLSSAGFFNADMPSKPDFTPLGDQDYQFIVDLPEPVVTAKSAYPIGHTPEFALNTLVLTPRLVVHANFEPFSKDTASTFAGGIMEGEDDRTRNELLAAKGPKPIVQPILSKSGGPPRQALVTVPLKGNVGDQHNVYGVLLSIGWLDPDAIHASKVKKVTVRLTGVQPAHPEKDGDLSDPDWNLNVAVNGRWFNFRFKVDTGGNPRVLLDKISGGPVEIEMLLAEDDFVMVSAHGMDEDAFDDLMRLPPEFRFGQTRPPKDPPVMPTPAEILDDPSKITQYTADVYNRTKVLGDRLLRHAADAKVPTGTPDPKTGTTPTTTVTVPLVGQEIEWNKDIDTDDDHQASLTARAMFLRMAVGNRFDANDLLGMIDPLMPDPGREDARNTAKRSNDSTDTRNPLVVGEIAKEVGLGTFKKCQLSAYSTTIVGRMNTMAYDPNKVDYTLFYEVKVEDLPES